MGNFQAACKTNPDDQDALRAIDLLYDAALVSSGFTVSLWLDIIILKYIVKLDYAKMSHNGC